MKPKNYIVKTVNKWTAPSKNDVRVLGMPTIYEAVQGRGCQPRTIEHSSEWDKMRKRCYFKANYKCEICGKDLGSGECQAHEIFSTNYVAGEAKFERLICLCQTCVDEDTEVLTSSGWKKIPTVTTDDNVACWDKDGSITFQHPITTVKSYKQNAIKITKGKDELFFSEDHRIPLRVAAKQSTTYGEIHDVLAKDYNATHYYNWLIGGVTKGDEHLSANERVFIAIEADGHLAWDKDNIRRRSDKDDKRQRARNNRYKSKKYRYTYTIRLLKTRKIERLKKLLEESTLAYKITKETSSNYCDFVVWTNVECKKFSNSFKQEMASNKALEFIEELIFWDGTYAQGISTWYTNKPEEIAFVQGVAAQCNTRTHVSVVNRIGNLRKGEWNTPYERLSYAVNFRSVKVELCARELKPQKIKWEKQMYCITTPTSYFIAKRGNLVFVTGNCHLLVIHVGRALTRYKHGDPLYSKKRLLDGVEHAFRLVSEYNKHRGDSEEELLLGPGILAYARQDELREPLMALLKKYNVRFYKTTKHPAEWGKWHVLYKGKKYMSPYKDHDAWEEKMKEMDSNGKRFEMVERYKGGVFDEIDKIIKEEENG